MTIGELIEECETQGISLRPGEGGKLRVSPPPERLPGELVEALRRHEGRMAIVSVEQRRRQARDIGTEGEDLGLEAEGETVTIALSALMVEQLRVNVAV